MIDVQTFQALLLIVALLAFVLSTLSLSGFLLVFKVQNVILRAITKLAFAALAVASGFCALMLAILK